MKPVTATLYFGSSLILALVVIALAIATPNIIFSGSNNTTPTSTPTPTPTATTPPTTPAANYTYKYPLTFTYDCQKTDLNNGQTAVGYIVTAAYHKDKPITINISDFYLKLSYQADTNTIDAGTVSPQNNGTINLDPSHATMTFELSFQFPTYSFTGAEQSATHFTLRYSGQAKLFGD